MGHIRRNIVLLGSAVGMLLTMSGCVLEQAQQWMREQLTVEEVVGAYPTPEPQETASVGSKKMDATLESEQKGEKAPSGKSYAYYDEVEPTYIDGVLLVNKEYALPRDYGDGVDAEAEQALENLQTVARRAGCYLPLLSGYRSFDHQEELYEEYSEIDGEELASTYSAWPGHSEHQTGLAFDVGSVRDEFAESWSGRWLAEHAHEFGFIIRYPQGKEEITGYKYEPWHIRYLGVELATEVYESGLCLEEFLGVA